MLRTTARFILGLTLSLTVGLPALAYELPNTETRLINTANPDQSYRLFIYTPKTAPPSGGYPVIYLLDGNSVFAAMVDEVRRKTAISYGDPAVIVAIGYPEDDPWNARRKQDLTPWVPAAEKNADQSTIAIPSGGADDFLEIIKSQIIPMVERDFTVNPHRRTLAGHSFGGLFTLHSYFKQPELFQNYVAASPSIWYADERLFEEFESYAVQYKNSPDTARLLLLVGGCEETAGECDPQRQPAPKTDEWLVTTVKMVSNAKTMYNNLRILRGATDVHLRVLEGENHTSVIGGSLGWMASFAMTSPTEPVTEKPE